MTASRWLVGFVVVTVLGSVAVGRGRPEIQTADAHPATVEGAGYCSNDDAKAANSKGSNAEAGVSSHADSSQAGLTSESCPSDMVEVAGEHCQVVEQICEEYISEKKDRCAKYRNKVRCFGKTKALHFCVDRYEYPNQAGAKPTVAVTFDEANELCAAEGKRLCNAEEWTQACEGPEHSPYAYGFERNDNACNHDKPYIIPNDFAYQNPETRAAEVARLNQSEPSGSRPRCVSSYGVFDMTGNVDEWVNNESGSVNGPEYQSGLKGGYWGPVRNRCRPMTTDHNHWHHGYQIGFRCCKNPGAEKAAPNVPEESRSLDQVSDRAPESVQEVSRS